MQYNRETGLFEVASEEAERVCRSIRSALHRRRSQLLAGDPTDLTTPPPVDNRYSVSVSAECARSEGGGFISVGSGSDEESVWPLQCLDRQEGVRWMATERLPLFLQSVFYSEYR